jgi:hypothetical protein
MFAAPPDIFTIFRESDFRRDSQGRIDYFEIRSQELASLFRNKVGLETSENEALVPWTIIRN